MTDIEVATTRTSKKMAVNWAFGGDDVFRSVAKMGLAAVAAEGDLPGDNRLREVVRFINGVTGLHGARHIGAEFDMLLAPAFRSAIGTQFGHHVLAIYSSAGHAEVAFIAFGVVCYRVRMFKSSNPIRPFAYIVRPVGGTDRYLIRRGFDVRGLPTIEDVASIQSASTEQQQDCPVMQELRTLLLLAKVLSDHGEAQRMAAAFVDASDPIAQGRTIDEVAIELSDRIARGEEIVLPTIRRRIPDLEARVRHGVEEGRRTRSERAASRARESD